MPKRIDLPKETLVKLYIKQKKSMKKIAKGLNVSWMCIRGNLKRYKIPIRKSLIPLDKNKIYELYVEKKMGAEKIAKELNVCPYVIFDRLRRFNIPVRQNIVCGRKRPLNYRFIPREVLYQKYVTEKKGCVKIARELNVNKEVVLSKLREYNIKRRNLLEAAMARFSIKDISKDVLVDLYVNQQKSSDKIAEEFGVSKTFVFSRLRRYNIPIRGCKESARIRYSDYNIPREVLYDLYVTQKKPVIDIAKELNVKIATIFKRLKEFRIPKRCPPVHIPKETLIELYINQKKSQREIAKILDVGIDSVYKWLVKFNIPTRKHKKYKCVDVSKETLQNLYITQNLSAEKIGKILGTHRWAIEKLLTSFNISIRKRDDYVNIPKEVLFDLYVNQKKSTRSIARFHNASGHTILRNLKKYDIRVRESIYGLKNEKIRCLDGDLVYSDLEREVDDFLFLWGITHQLYRKIGYGNYKCDFFIPDANIWIEVWGMIGLKSYDEKIKRKQKIYREILGLNLVDIFPSDFPNGFKKKLEFLIPICSHTQRNMNDYINQTGVLTLKKVPSGNPVV